MNATSNLLGNSRKKETDGESQFSLAFPAPTVYYILVMNNQKPTRPLTGSPSIHVHSDAVIRDRSGLPMSDPGAGSLPDELRRCGVASERLTKCPHNRPSHAGLSSAYTLKRQVRDLPGGFTFNFDRARVPVARTGPFDATATWAARCPLSPPEPRVKTVSDRGQESHRARSDNSSGGGCSMIRLQPPPGSVGVA